MSFALGQRVSPLHLAVLISGGGTTLRNLIQKIAAGKLDAKIVLVISSTAKAGGLQIAADGRNSDDWSSIQRIRQRRPNLAKPHSVRAARPTHTSSRWQGYLKHVLIPPDFENRVTNIHPALIPACCGPGMYGRRVHEAVLESAAKLSGCTVHFVDNQYDHGPIILQRTVPVLDDDTPDSLAARVFAAECEAYPEALRMIGAGRVRVVDGRVIK